MRTRAASGIRKAHCIRIVQCAWCARPKLGRWYMPLRPNRLFLGELRIDLPPLPRIVLGTTHSICPECATEIGEKAREWHLVEKREGESKELGSCALDSARPGLRRQQTGPGFSRPAPLDRDSSRAA